MYWISTILAAIIPLAGNWGFLALYIFEAITAPKAKYLGFGGEDGYNYVYITTKIVLIGFFNVVAIWTCVQVLYPIYSWWWSLARLKDFIPYQRPTE